MLNTHKRVIISNLSDLVEQTDLNTLVPELLERNVLKARMISKIFNPSHPPRRQKTDLYIQILNSGPQAFQELIDSLSVTNHTQLANILKVMAENQSPSVDLNSSIISSSSECLTSTNFELDGPCLSSPKEENSQINDLKKPNDNLSLVKSFHNSCCSQHTSQSSLVTYDVKDSSTSSSDDKMFALPAYLIPLQEALRATGISSSSDIIVNFQTEKYLPVNVVKSKHWPKEAAEKPLCYKMDSNPRGCLLLINNIKFNDEENYPERSGADNDQIRVVELFKQFHFEVETHVNKTKMEMEVIVSKFSRNEKLHDVDCICVIIMSHGEEGESKEDSEILGVDGVGFKGLDIVSFFDNDVCIAAVNKPKLFFFQACRGCLVDPGVSLYRQQISKRIETDGRKVTLINVKVRSQSDIFIARPVPPGIMANRDKLTGTWFIQTIIQVFSAHAWNTHLEDLMKLVDQKIKRMNNLYNENFQSLTTKTIGWNKNLFFNPGIYKDKTGKTLLIGGDDDNPDPEEGMDVVDSCRSKPSKNRIENDYSRLKDDDDDKTSWCCLN